MNLTLHRRTAVVTAGARGIAKATVGCVRATVAGVGAIDVAPIPGTSHGTLIVECERHGGDHRAIAAVAQLNRLDICVADAGTTFGDGGYSAP